MPLNYPERALLAIQAAWAWLATQGDYAQPAVALALCFGIPWFLRTVVSEQWEAVTNWAVFALSKLVGPELALKVRKAVQAVPSLCVAAALGVLVEGGDLGAILRLELYALFAPLLHEWMKRYRGGSPPAARTVVAVKNPLPPSSGPVLLLLGLPLLLLIGCGTSLVDGQRAGLSQRLQTTEQRLGYVASERCQQLSDREMWWNSASLGGLVVTGTSGIATLPIEELDEKDQGKARLASASVALGAAIFTGIAQGVARGTRKQFQEECQP